MTYLDIKENKSMNYSVQKNLRDKIWNDPETATFEELLSVLLGSRRKGGSIFEISRDIACLARTEKGLLYLGPDTIASITGVGKARAASIVAAVELARRQHKNEWPQKRSVNLKQLAFHLQANMEGRGNEYFYLFSFNKSLGLIQEHVVARGGSEAVHVHFRDILKILLNDRAFQVLIAHNHPEECALPSKEDLSSMKRLEDILEEIGINLLDQFIVGIDGVYSCMRKRFIISKIDKKRKLCTSEV